MVQEIPPTAPVIVNNDRTDSRSFEQFVSGGEAGRARTNDNRLFLLHPTLPN